MRVLTMEDVGMVSGAGDAVMCEIAKGDLATAQYNHSAARASLNVPLMVVTAVQIGLAYLDIDEHCN